MLRPAIILAMVLWACSTHAQTDISWDDSLIVTPRIAVSVDGSVVEIGGYDHVRKNVRTNIEGREISPDSPEGRQALTEDPMDLQTVYEDIESFIDQTSLLVAPLLPSDSTRLAESQNHERWLRARDKHCASSIDDGSASQRLDYLRCMNWVSECRLQDLLKQYDDLSAP